MDAAAHIAELRAWHALIADRMRGMPPGFEPATYARWRDVGVLLDHIKDLEGRVAALTKAPTDPVIPAPRKWR